MPAADKAVSMKRQKSYIAQRESRTGWLFVLPALILFVCFVLLPTLAMLVLGFTKYNMLKPPTFNGLDNLMEVLTDQKLHVVAWNTCKLTVAAVILNIVIGLVLALMIANRRNGIFSYIIRLLYFFPAIVAPAYIAVIWTILLAKDTGLVNYYLGKNGIEPIGWLTDASVSLWSIIGIDVWRNIGFIMIILLAGIKNISYDYYEAAALDGANAFQLARHITIPLLTPSILFVLIINVISELKSFDIPNIMTKGDPVDSTRTMAMYIYNLAFQRMNMGYACMVSILFVAVIMVVTVIQLKMSDRWVNYD